MGKALEVNSIPKVQLGPLGDTNKAIGGDVQWSRFLTCCQPFPPLVQMGI